MKPRRGALWMRGILATMAWLEMGCFQTQTAGTSTTTGNTITAAAQRSDGSPAAYARVSLRASGSIPENISTDVSVAPYQFDTIANSSGLFTLRVPDEGSYFLAINAGPDSAAEVFWLDSVQASNLADTVGLSQSGRLRGNIVSGTDSVLTAPQIWVGFPGTESFTPVASDGSFALNSLPPGSGHLVALRRFANGTTEVFPLQGWKTVASETTVLDSIVLPAHFAGTVPTLSCLENPSHIQLGLTASGPTHAALVFRTLRLSPQPELVEIDLCRGEWKTKLALPVQIIGAVDLFSGSTYDYALRIDTRQAWALDSTTAHNLGNFSVDLAEADFQGGQYFANYHGDSLRIFPDEASWLNNHPVQAIAIPPVSPQKFAVGDSSVFFLAQSDSARIYRWKHSLGVFANPVTLAGFSGNCVGMAAGTGQEFWLLNDGNNLYRYDGLTGALLFKTHIEISDSLRGLAGPFR